MSNCINNTQVSRIASTQMVGADDVALRHSLSALPEELVVQIIGHLPPRDVLVVAQVSQRMAALALTDAYWNQLYRCEKGSLKEAPKLAPLAPLDALAVVKYAETTRQRITSIEQMQLSQAHKALFASRVGGVILYAANLVLHGLIGQGHSGPILYVTLCASLMGAVAVLYVRAVPFVQNTAWVHAPAYRERRAICVLGETLNHSFAPHEHVVERQQPAGRNNAALNGHVSARTYNRSYMTLGELYRLEATTQNAPIAYPICQECGDDVLSKMLKDRDFAFFHLGDLDTLLGRGIPVDIGHLRLAMKRGHAQFISILEEKLDPIYMKNICVHIDEPDLVEAFNNIPAGAINILIRHMPLGRLIKLTEDIKHMLQVFSKFHLRNADRGEESFLRLIQIVGNMPKLTEEGRSMHELGVEAVPVALWVWPHTAT